MTGHRALRDAATWLHLSPARVRRLYSGEGGVFPGLSPEGLDHLRRVDSRAWGTDSAMRTRMIGALVEEFPVSLAVLGVEVAGTFIDSDEMWAVLGGRARLTDTFSGFLLPLAGGMAGLEGAIAAARRDRNRPVAPAGVRTLAGISTLLVDAGIFRCWQREWSAGADLPCRVAAGLRVNAPPEELSPVHVLIQARGNPVEILLSELGEAAGELFSWLAEPRGFEAVVGRLIAAEMSRAEAMELIDRWRAEGLLAGS